MDWTLDMTAGAELLAETLCDINDVNCGERYEILMTGCSRELEQSSNATGSEDY